MKLNTQFVRSQFPAFDGFPGSEWAFFENAGGAYGCRPVVDRTHEFMTRYKVQPYGPSEMARRAGEAMDAGYLTIADLLDTRVENLTLGPSTTINLYVLAQALRSTLRPGDEIVVTNQDHEANIGCWRRLEEHGIVIREWRVDEWGELRTEGLESVVGPKTRVVCFTLSSNIISTLNPVSEVVEIAKRHGALVVGDAVSYAPHNLPAVEETGLDFFLFSTYKTFASHQGVMWGSDEALGRTSNQGHYFNADKPNARLNPAGPQHGEIAALAGLRDYFEDLDTHHFAGRGGSLHQRVSRVMGLVREHEARLTARLISGIDEIDGLRVLGKKSDETDQRSSVVSVTSKKVPPATLASKLAEKKIAVGSGHFYAIRLLEALGIDPARGVLRISLVHYNTDEEVDRLLEALSE